jgi:molybdopterin synthase sulfur carrier subunit
MEVRIFGSLRPLVGQRAIEVAVPPGGTVGDMLARTAASYPALGARMLDEGGRPTRAVHVLVNGRSIAFLDGVDTVLQEGDRIALFPPVGGG